MPSINVIGAAARMLAFKTNTPNQCLNYVWQAIAQGKYHYLTGGAANAYATWVAVPEANKHHADRNVPKDMPAFLGPRVGSAAGDVIISRGDGTFVATDYPHSGVISICTLQQRITQTGRPYAGWADSMGGYNLTGSATAGGGATPIDPTYPVAKKKDPDMPSLIARNDGTPAAPKWTYALFDGEHWEETADPSLASIWAQLYNEGNSARDVTAAGIAAWNYRSNSRPDLKKPFGVVATSGSGTVDLTGVATTVQVNAARDAVIAKIPTKLAP